VEHLRRRVEGAGSSSGSGGPPAVQFQGCPGRGPVLLVTPGEAQLSQGLVILQQLQEGQQETRGRGSCCPPAAYSSISRLLALGRRQHAHQPNMRSHGVAFPACVSRGVEGQSPTTCHRPPAPFLMTRALCMHMHTFPLPPPPHTHSHPGPTSLMASHVSRTSFLMAVRNFWMGTSWCALSLAMKGRGPVRISSLSDSIIQLRCWLLL
jgi:hypothetical protein